MRRHSLTLLGLLATSACAAQPGICVRAPSLSIVAEPDMNDNSAVALDLVFITERAALPLIEGLSARDYFARKAAVQGELVAALQIVALQLPTGLVMKPVLPARPKCFAAIFAFANYRSEGSHRLSLDASTVELRLRRDGATVLRR